MLMIKDFTRFYPVVSRLIKPYDRRSVERQRGRADLDTREDDFARTCLSLAGGGAHKRSGAADHAPRLQILLFTVHVMSMSMSMCMYKHVSGGPDTPHSTRGI